ncbi:hypothetical protein EVAR_43448_1 [Eumeta japonica]|uniref:Uncharacterized protein n=1 Tax=Eumeta variegata TaxID=151549 RepID=A0A4C1YCZ4_EUMVA|nr:hypothetical protein EVAR_43448_1 [Eumeta japonica]
MLDVMLRNFVPKIFALCLGASVRRSALDVVVTAVTPVDSARTGPPRRAEASIPNARGLAEPSPDRQSRAGGGGRRRAAAHAAISRPLLFSAAVTPPRKSPLPISLCPVVITHSRRRRRPLQAYSVLNDDLIETRKLNTLHLAKLLSVKLWERNL